MYTFMQMILSYTMAPSLKVAIDSLQNDFNSFQTSLGNIQLDFTQFRLSLNYVMIQTLNGTQIEIVASYKYLGIIYKYL